MFNKSDFKVESIFSSRAKLRGMFIKRVFADELEEGNLNDGSSQSAPQQEINFEQLIANARKEEKEKLYPRIRKLEDENKALVKSSNEALLKLAQVTGERDDYKSKLEKAEKADDSEEVKELKGKIATLEKDLEEAKKVEVPNEEELRTQIEQEFEQKYKVKEYKMNKLSENKGAILDVFVGEVSGDTEEEIDKSINSLIEKSNEVKKSLGLIDDDGNPIDNGTRNIEIDDKPPKVNPKNPSGVEEFTSEYIRNLKPGTPEYTEFRKKLGLN